MKFENREIRMVWLDLDDTIIDFETNSHNALRRLWSEETAVNRLFPSANGWIEIYGKHNHRLWTLYSEGLISRTELRMERFRRPLEEGGASRDEATTLAGRFDTLYLDFLARERALIPGSIDLLRSIRARGVKIGCLSNGFKDVQFRKIRNCGLEPWFDLVVLSDDIGINKPDARLFKHAASLSGHDDPHCHLMIGDNAATDIAGALGAGWTAIHFLRHHNSVAHEGCPGVRSLLEIPPLFD